jgi:hypothetical protein
MTGDLASGLAAAEKAETLLRRAASIREFEGQAGDARTRERAAERAAYFESQARELAPELSRLRRAILRLEAALGAETEKRGAAMEPSETPACS